MDVAEFDRLRERLDEDFFRASRRSIVGSVFEVSSGQYCSSGQRPSVTQTPIGSVARSETLATVGGSLQMRTAGCVRGVRCRFWAGPGLGSRRVSTDCLRLRPRYWTGAGCSCTQLSLWPLQRKDRTPYLLRRRLVDFRRTGRIVCGALRCELLWKAIALSTRCALARRDALGSPSC